MLKNIDILQQMAELHIQKYVQILRYLHDVIISCFRMSLDSEYVTYIQKLKYLYVELGIFITPKVHILIYHIPDFIKKHLEQALESVHHDFLRNF